MDVRSLEERTRNVILDTRSDFKFSKVSPFSYYGSIGATRVPPFDYQWSWEWDLNSPSIKKLCSSAKGEMGFSLWGNESISSSGSAQTAIGIYFMPPSRNGHLLASASPGFSSLWGTWCALASAHTDGYIGLLVVSYNTSDNSYASTIIDQRIALFSDDSWFHGIGLLQSRNSGYPLSAMFPVDNAHWYAIWIVSSGHIDAAGYDAFSGSGALSSISTGISSMSWMYFG